MTTPPKVKNNMASDNPSNGFPKVHVYTVCWNEETILPHFLNHYACFEKVVVYDNESTDGSADCIRAAKNAELRYLKTEGQYAEEILCNFKNNVWKESRGQADFVIICDVDELLYHPELLAVTKEMKQRGATIMLPMAYQMIGDDALDADQDILSCIPGGVRLYNYDKSILFDPNKIEEINFGLGAHVCRPTGQVDYFRVPGLCLLHYKYLNVDYVWNRNQLYTARTSAEDIAKNYSPHHRMAREHIEQRYQQLKEIKIDVVAMAKKKSNDGWLNPPANLANAYRQGIKAFKDKNYDVALEKITEVVEWSPTRYRLNAALAVILFFRKMFYLEWRYMLGRTEAIASTLLPRERALRKISAFYEESQHPKFAQYCIDFIDELKNDAGTNT